MSLFPPKLTTRVMGTDAVLARLKKLGEKPRVFPNLVAAGFPEDQLVECCGWYARAAETPVQKYAAERMAQGFFDDEPLLDIFCRFYNCQDWQLENSHWFFSLDDYQRFNDALIGPVGFEAGQLDRGVGEERWGGYFTKLPFDLGMEKAKQALWEGLMHQQPYWRPMTSYLHLRAENLRTYLERTVDITNFNPLQFNYLWEQRFKVQFAPALLRFEEKLEKAVRLWAEKRRERTQYRFEYRTYHRGEGPLLEGELHQAFQALGLHPAKITREGLQKAFRRLSKQAHPDHGGAAEDFQRLSRYRNLIESWLISRG